MKKALALLLLFTMITGTLAGCGNESLSTMGSAASVGESSATEPLETPNTDMDTSSAQEISGDTTSITMPLADHDVTLGMWIEFPPFLEGSTYNSPADFPFYQNLSNVSGIDFDFTTVSMMAASEQFNLAVASQSFPEIICNPSYYSGSVDDAIENDVFMDVTDQLPEYAPDYLAVINRDDETRRAAYSADGRVGVFWEIAKELFPANSGLVIRQDWLDETNMDAPSTYEELHDVLVAFKEKYNAESPIYTDSKSIFLELSSGYNLKDDFTNQNGNVVYSANAEELLDYITMMNQWYADGLIYADYASYSENNVESDEVKTRLVNSNQVGVWYNWCEDLQQYEVDDPNFALTAIANPVKKPGDVIHICSGVDPLVSTSGGWAISADCDEEKALIAIQLIDYLYTEDGAILSGLDTGLTYAYNVDARGFANSGLGWVVEDDTVKCTFDTDGFRGYLELLSDYYKQGFYNDDFVNISYELGTVDSTYLSGRCGVFYAGLAALAESQRQNASDPDFKVAALHDIKLNADDPNSGVSEISYTGINSIAISTQCAEPEKAMMFCNYFYTEEGQRLANWGVEGETYTVENGEPQYTDLVKNDTQCFMYMLTQTRYALQWAPTIFDAAVSVASYDDGQRAAAEMWTAEREAYMLIPKNVTQTAEEQAVESQYGGDVATYLWENIFKIATNQQSMDSFDEVIETANGMGLAEITEVRQASYDRYMEMHAA